jgi:parvulin-like peptidyl-prolyl isomerase
VSLRRFLRDPLIHFLLIGAALFGLHAVLRPGGKDAAGSKQIALSLDDLSQLALAFQAQWRRQPTPEELSRLIEDRIREEVLYREALAMGLDRDDSIVRRRMAQKMEFLAEDVAAAHEPGSDELRTWYAAHRGEFAQPPRISFRHAWFSPDRRGERAQADAAEALAKLAGQLEDSPLAAADPFPFQDYYGERTPEQLARDFGPGFAQAVAKLAPGSWQGPIESGYGWHLLFVDSLVPGRIPDFEEIEPEVKTAWLADQKEQAWNKAYDEMRAKYTVLLPAPPEQKSP